MPAARARPFSKPRPPARLQPLSEKEKDDDPETSWTPEGEMGAVLAKDLTPGSDACGMITIDDGGTVDFTGIEKVLL